MNRSRYYFVQIDDRAVVAATASWFSPSCPIYLFGFARFPSLLRKLYVQRDLDNIVPTGLCITV